MTKYRLETFTDGVIAIIITIMVLSIPLPKTFEISDLWGFSSSLFIYLLSFLVVGGFWNQHHQAFVYLEKVNNKIIASNIFFLFFLSLIPLFTKWVIQNQGVLLPVIGFDTVYLAVSFFYVITLRLIMEQSDHDDLKKIKERIKYRRKARPRLSWIPFVLLLVVISGVVFVSRYFPKISTFVLMGIPITSSIINLFISQLEKRVNLSSKEK